MKANKTRKNKKQSGGFKFLTDMFNKGKEGWNKGKNMFSKPKPVTTLSSTSTTPPEASKRLQSKMWRATSLCVQYDHQYRQ